MERRKRSSQKLQPVGSNSSRIAAAAQTESTVPTIQRSPVKVALRWGALAILMLYSAWSVYRFQYLNLPAPLDPAQAGKRGFSETRAMQHVKVLTGFGPHPVGSDALDRAVKYVYSVAQKIQESARWDAEIEIDLFHSKPSAFRLKGGIFKGKTLAYGDLKHVLMRITPKHSFEAVNHALLISSHIDTVFSTEGAGDCSSCVAVMLELARAASNWANGFRNSLIFLFNTGEEEGLDGAHSFITQHPWNSSIRLVVDLEATGVGGKSSLFQGGPDPWIVEILARVAKHPSAQSLSQDIFQSGIIKSATDFQIYREVAGLSGLDFAYMRNTATYHTKNDKLKFLSPGSLQHLGDNMLSLLLEVVTSPNLKNIKSETTDPGSKRLDMVYFDILGMYMITYSSELASSLYISIVLQALMIWSVSLYQGGVRALLSTFLGCFTILITWVLSLSFSSLVALTLPYICTSPLPFIASPWLLVGLFAAPAVVGALLGHHIGYVALHRYLSKLEIKRHNLSSKEDLNKNQLDHIAWDAQRWLFKAGFIQWILVLLLFTWAKLASAYMAFVWLVSPAMSYGLFEATLSPTRQPRELRISSLIIGLIPPMLLTSGNCIAMVEILAGTMVRFDRNPGEKPEWFASLIVALLIAVVVCLLFAYLFPYAHASGGFKWIILGTFGISLLSLGIVAFNAIEPFTEEIGRALNVVEVINVTRRAENSSLPQSYTSMYSLTPGKLSREMEILKDERFTCNKENPLDFVTYTVKYGCVSTYDVADGWNEANIPVIKVESDTDILGQRKTVAFVDVKVSNRWVMALNTREIRSMKMEILQTKAGTNETLVPEEELTSVDGWHILQFVTEKHGPRKFYLTLFWHKNSTDAISWDDHHKENRGYLIKLRTDINEITPRVARLLDKLPNWCVLFGKSTSPFTLSYFNSLRVDFSLSSFS